MKIDYQEQIVLDINHLKRLGYSEQSITQVITNYTGYPDWISLSYHQQRRLAMDLNRYVHIARKWHYCLNGWVQ